MILPISHQEGSFRRLPWVTFSIMALCLLAFLFTDTDAADRAPGPEDYLEQAAGYWREHAYLEADPVVRESVAYDVMLNQRSQYLETLAELAMPLKPLTAEGVAAEQAELDRLTGLALGTLQKPAAEQNAYERWGLVPSAPRPHAFVTHMFMHAGWLHLIGNLFMLLLAGPPIEERWGRATFAAFYALAGLFAAAFYLGWVGDSPIPIVGASGAIAGVLGAFLIRLWKTQIRFAYVFFLGLRPIWGTFEAPAWAMLPLWFANELLLAFAWDTGMSGGVAYAAHVGGFLAGMGGALLVGALRIEERFVDPHVEARLTRFVANPVLEDAMAARERGDFAEARALLEAEWERAPDEEIALALWDAALACEEPAGAAAAMAHAVRSAAQRGEVELAMRHWSELSDLVPAELVPPALLLRFVPPLVAENQRDRAALALRQAVHPDNVPLSPGQALRILDLARELDPPSALRAARVALTGPDLHDAKREKLMATVAALEAEGVEEIAVAEDRSELAPELPETAWGEDGPVRIARFGQAKLTEARPVRLDAERVYLALADEREAAVALRKIEAVAVAIVDDLGPRPTLVIDLLANWNQAEAESLEGVRLRSDRFDARTLLDLGGDPRAAFAALVLRVLEASRAVPLPSIRAASGDPFARYETLADYEARVLEVGR